MLSYKPLYSRRVCGVGDMFEMHALKGDELTKGSKRGQIAISPRLLFDVLNELCAEIYRNGFIEI